MKAFAVIQSGFDVHIFNTTKNYHPRQLIIGEADTYEDAKEIRDERRKQLTEQRTKSVDKWHAKWDKTYEEGNFDHLNQLSGIR